MATTNIAWADAVWNPLVGCSRVSEGCRHCYAEAFAGRLAAMGQARYQGLTKKVGDETRWTGEIRLVEEALPLPLRWRKPRRIFVNSMSDLFHESVLFDEIDHIFAVMALAPRHTFQVLTKRPGLMAGYMESGRGRIVLGKAWSMLGSMPKYEHGGISARPWPLPNVHLGVSVEDQRAADERIPLLLQAPAALRFISYEPALGPLNLLNADGDGLRGGLRGALHWLIVGGESGRGYRPMDLAWLTSIVEQCRAAGVPVFVKQDSGPRPGMQGRIPDELWALKGVPG